jgi:hypothetical protein
MAYRPEFDVHRPQPGDADLAAAIRKGIERAKLDGSVLSQADVARVPGRLPSDSERKMWTECVHGVSRGKPCKDCEEEDP